MANDDGERGYVWERYALREELEKTEREVSFLHSFWVARGDSVTMRIWHRREVCETQVMQENRNARRWANSVVERLRDARARLMQCCDQLVVQAMRMRRELERWRTMWEDSRMQHDAAQQALRDAIQERDEASRERDDARKSLEADEIDLQVVREQADTAWLFFEDVVNVGSPPASEEHSLSFAFDDLSLTDKGKAPLYPQHTGGTAGPATTGKDGVVCPTCQEVSAHMSQMESEMVRLRMANELLQLPASFWEEADKELQNFVVPLTFLPPPARRSSS
ncbi:hypothetical protein CBR_g9054 [Chara braunii]|uniref:Uncharacterized protein n=1 Tax=Chara braunii TaxID=69332 RepID=A0A388KNQ6_CHABU|nr:hypothetical protein CBR_g9054 [Chara braunii]|eukprot:GBG71638.1 hypothetical protein CBR_g9054 [Chara braunii]